MPPPRIPPNKGIPDFPAQSIIVDTLVREKRSRYPTLNTPLEPGTPYTALNHSQGDVTEFGNTFLIAQKATDSPEDQELIWVSAPATQDLYNYDLSYSDDNISYPIFKRRYLELRDTYVPRNNNSVFSGIYRVTVTAGGSNYTNGAVVTFTGGGGSGASAIVVTNSNGTIVKITLKSEGSGYTSAPTVVLPAGAGGSATAVLQPFGCQLVKESVSPASETWSSLYFLVERIYETLVGPTRVSWAQNPLTQVPYSTSKMRIPTNTMTEPTVVLGQNVTCEHINASVTDVSTKLDDPTLMDSFFRAFPSLGSVNLPRVLISLGIVWDVASAAGTYTANGSGAAIGTSASVSTTAQGRAQGSASVVPELVPVWAPRWTNDIPVVDFYFFLPKNATVAEILVAASAFATIWYGTATTINAWPLFQPTEPQFAIVGQKISVSAEALATCSVSIVQGSGGTNASEALAYATGSNKDIGDTVRPVALPECLTAGLVLTNSSNSESVTCTADADVASGTNFPGATSSASASGTAYGFVTPASIGATSPPGYPISGLYGQISSQEYEDGYSAYRVRTINMGIFPHQAQETLVDFNNVDGTNYVTGAAGLSFVLYCNGSTVVIGVWFNTGTESQPDLSSFSGSIIYCEINISSSDTGEQIATNTTSILGGTFGSNFTAVQVDGGGTLTAVLITDTQVGPEIPANVNTSETLIAVAPGY